MHQAHSRPILFGEVLFDRFPDGNEVLGGAPFNVAWHLRGFGENPLFISRVGDDDSGRQVRLAMTAWGMDCAGLQTDPAHPTGAVRIELIGGEPRFEILPDQAYDFIYLADIPELERPAFFYHGSLALRREESRTTLETLLRHLDMPVFLDVNLRPPWWSKADILRWVARADWVKLNQNELELLAPGQGDLTVRARQFLAQYDLRQLLLTRGEEGALALRAKGEDESVRPAAATQVVDTVGAGDSFTAVFLLGQLRGWPLAATLERAQSFASAIVGVRGATVADRAFYQRFLKDWGE
ncbi:MAG: carbohydrate kinase [Gallionellaceae bacterium]|nr:carbohydrate kinase [Gallionellaceae bacterium]